MPTARELLEQADALMRRNRAAAVDDIPVLTDSVALPVEMSSAAVAIPAPADVAAPAPRGAAHVPTLTEAVAVTGDESVDSVIQEGEPSDWLHDDRDSPSVIGDAPDSIAIVPYVARPPAPAAPALDAEAIASAELEEIELTTPAEAAFDDEFEPADAYADADAPRPGLAPAAAIDVEAATPARASTDAWYSPWSSPAGIPTPRVEAEAPAMPAPPVEPVAEPDDAAGIEVTAHGAPSVPTQETGVPAVATTMAAAESAFEEAPAVDGGAATFEAPAREEIAAPHLPEIVAAAGSALEEAPAVDDAAATVVAPAPEEPAPPHLPETVAAVTPLPGEKIPAAAFVAPPAVSAPPAVAVAEDSAKWDAIAEEIRVQVLQRIDLFTDAGLREQLGMRLKPIVDRASADLVATINLHVGELLRAYVAEAIEREIENWRNNH